VEVDAELDVQDRDVLLAEVFLSLCSTMLAVGGGRLVDGGRCGSLLASSLG
jgi:hypothetical protein